MVSRLPLKTVQGIGFSVLSLLFKVFKGKVSVVKMDIVFRVALGGVGMDESGGIGFS